MENQSNEIMEIAQSWEVIFYIITGLVGILVVIAWFGLREQILFNKENSEEHAKIDIRLATGSKSMESLSGGVKKNGDDIKELDDKIDKHAEDIVGVKKDINTIYKKIE